MINKTIKYFKLKKKRLRCFWKLTLWWFLINYQPSQVTGNGGQTFKNICKTCIFPISQNMIKVISVTKQDYWLPALMENSSWCLSHEATQNVDGNIPKFKEWSSIKQYAKNKPVEWDIVVLVLQDISTSFTCTWKRKKMQGEYRRKYSSNPNWMPWNHALKLFFFFFFYNNFLIRLSIWLGLNENGEKAPRKQLLKEAWTIVITKFCFPKKWIAVNGLLCHQL